MRVEPVAIPTTSGALAMANLGARIEGLELRIGQGSVTVADRAGLVEALCLRGHLVGCIADLEYATELAEQWVRVAPAVGVAYFARARVRGGWHRFSDAWRDLDTAQRHGMDPVEVDDERVGILQAVGRYDEALVMRRDAVERCADFRSFAGLAGIHAERGEVGPAERMFRESRRCYRGVSPFPLAILEVAHGHLWLAEGDLQRARARFEAARQRVPGYASAQGHLAEVDAALGEAEAAIARLRPLVSSSDDPCYAAQLAGLLAAAGRAEESSRWRRCAARRYEELLMRHAEAFADHAAEFWLGAGEDPARAVELASLNVEVRATPRARALLTRAVRAQRMPAPTTRMGRDPD